MPLDKIIIDKDLPNPKNLPNHRPLPRGSRIPRDPVVVNDGEMFLLLGGAKKVHIAKESGELSIECLVRKSVTHQEKWELRLAEEYHSSLVTPMQLGRSFMKYREAFGITQQELARRTSITPGTIHHYESLIRTLAPELGDKVTSGELTFKEARSIADIDDHVRQKEIATPFIKGTLSSVHVERIVGLAKSSPELSISQIIEEVIDGKRHSTLPPIENEIKIPPKPREKNTESLENTMLNLAGELEVLHMQIIPEYRRLKLISSLRILDSRLKSALASLNSGQAKESVTLRPMGTLSVKS